MRKVLPGDLDLAARALGRVPQAQRHILLKRLLTEAQAADKYVRRLGRAHRLWGDGSLGAAARARPMSATPDHHIQQVVRDLLQTKKAASTCPRSSAFDTS